MIASPLRIHQAGHVQGKLPLLLINKYAFHEKTQHTLHSF